ncbi:E3 ubiquitin-protein ligase RNF135 [Striga asiatica]|uniref:E3 ubiquitin-protein ligase RNF135 n=1 Tax=Striga asiatica TaxID=4170 RepID=A0A5A7NVQ3_STRAF|nr:E3 ubiquitin-protein ligase RNF135 [Striga asiatica]
MAGSVRSCVLLSELGAGRLLKAEEDDRGILDEIQNERRLKDIRGLYDKMVKTYGKGSSPRRSTSLSRPTNTSCQPDLKRIFQLGLEPKHPREFHKQLVVAAELSVQSQLALNVSYRPSDFSLSLLHSADILNQCTTAATMRKDEMNGCWRLFGCHAMWAEGEHDSGEFDVAPEMINEMVKFFENHFTFRERLLLYHALISSYAGIHIPRFLAVWVALTTDILVKRNIVKKLEPLFSHFLNLFW